VIKTDENAKDFLSENCEKYSNKQEKYLKNTERLSAIIRNATVQHNAL